MLARGCVCFIVYVQNNCLPCPKGVRETVRFILHLPTMQTRQNVEQLKAYFSAVKTPHNPPHEAAKDSKGCRQGRCKSRTGQAAVSKLQVCQLTDLKQTKDWEWYPNRFKHICDNNNVNWSCAYRRPERSK